MTGFKRAILLMAAVVGWPIAAAAECPELAKVEWWTNTVPDVRRTVEANFQGSWDAYIARWNQQRDELQRQHDGNGSVEIKSRNLTLQGDELKDYIALVDERIATLECLKGQYADAADPNVATTASSSLVAPPQQAKMIEGDELYLEILPMCQDGAPAFQVTNLGEKWPRIADVSIYRADTKARMTQRRVRMVNSQQMIFKIPLDAARAAGEVAIFVEPTWYERKFEFDARTKC